MKTEQLFMEMMAYLAGEPELMHHFIKVHSFAKRIGMAEHLDEKSLAILETAATVHDIGIKTSQAKYGDCSGKHQEELGPALAESLLNQLDYPKDMIDRVKTANLLK
jgi:HD superfamily phosphodiesterase